jgi:hypothetical protein
MRMAPPLVPNTDGCRVFRRTVMELPKAISGTRIWYESANVNQDLVRICVTCVNYRVTVFLCLYFPDNQVVEQE